MTATITAAETGFAAQFGVSPGEIHGCLPSDLVHTRSPAHLRQRFTDLCEGRTLWFTEGVIGQHSSGRTFAADLTAGTATGPTGLTGLVLRLRPAAGEAPPPAHAVLSGFDARILDGVATGAPTVQLAEQLCLSSHGVDYHVRQMLRRFDARTRHELVTRARALGLLAPDAA
ncbi:LuxR C-terminal-related transcriptional regulator [Streptomyces flavofungini]|uniref:LuxR C-terminal-related transcriptional regulator n=1 Tax=Streptomyces flavofungini TaxID=68200 RepID=UPI0034E0498D